MTKQKTTKLRLKKVTNYEQALEKWLRREMLDLSATTVI